MGHNFDKSMLLTILALLEIITIASNLIMLHPNIKIMILIRLLEKYSDTIFIKY